MSNPIRSAVVIARLLGTEGFSDHVANRVENYYRHKSDLTQKELKRIRELDQEISRITKPLSEKDKLLLGKFIGLHKKMSFNTGLKIGIQAFATNTDKPLNLESINRT